MILDIKLTTVASAENPVIGDLELINGDLVWFTDPNDRAAAVSQDIRARLLLMQGEYFLDENLGIPYLQEILGAKNPDLASLRFLFAGVVEETAGVSAVNEMNLNLDSRTRELTITYSATIDADPDFTIRESVSLILR